MKSHRLRRHVNLLAAALGLAITIPGTVMAAQNWLPQHILEAFETPYTTSGVGVGVIAHRGLVANGCPENSTCSILNTYRNNIEAIELDVKEDGSGLTWLSHDQNVGRELDHSPNFNIFQGAVNPQGWDPDIRSLNSKQLTAAFLRDRNFAATGYHPVSLERALQTVKNSANHMLVILDLKTVTAVQQATRLTQQYDMQDQVVLKFSASLISSSPAAGDKLAGGDVAWVPTIYAGDMDNIADAFKVRECGNMAYCRVREWVTEARRSGASWIEIGNKQARRGDPTYALLSALKDGQTPVGAFTPVPEYRISSRDGYHFVRSNGTCCASLDNYLSSTKYFGTELGDDRPNYGGQVAAGATNIISDNPLDVINHVSRKTGRYY